MMGDEGRWCAFSLLLSLSPRLAGGRPEDVKLIVLTTPRSLRTHNIIYHITIAPLAICERRLV
jgi:hypothetical protein